MTARAPDREVLRVLECAGPRGGIIYVHVLSCGCFKTFRKPVRKATCIACFVVQQGGATRRTRAEILVALQPFVFGPEVVHNVDGECGCVQCQGAECARCYSMVGVRDGCEWAQGVDICDSCAQELVTAVRQVLGA